MFSDDVAFSLVDAGHDVTRLPQKVANLTLCYQGLTNQRYKLYKRHMHITISLRPLIKNTVPQTVFTFSSRKRLEYLKKTKFVIQLFVSLKYNGTSGLTCVYTLRVSFDHIHLSYYQFNSSDCDHAFQDTIDTLSNFLTVN